MTLCTDRVFVNADTTSAEIKGLRCKRWDCEICKPFNRMRVMHAAKNGRPNLFMTLTCDHKKYSSPSEAARDMKRGLVLLRRMIERRWKVKNVPFIVVFEAHESGWPHMHLLLRAPYMHWKVLRGMWEHITGAFQVHVSEIKTIGQALFYVTKYIGKDLGKFDGCKRWWRSHNYNQIDEKHEKPRPRGLMYMRVDGEFHQMCDTLEKMGWYLEQSGRYSVEATPLGWKAKRLDEAFWRSIRGIGA